VLQQRALNGFMLVSPMQSGGGRCAVDAVWE
jgi:hypothetical protein